jgi:AmmeMemoRadiSam system protein B
MSPFGSARIRESAIAGTWYPGSAPDLRRMVEGYLAQAKSADLPGKVVALVSPHAGYIYSGSTAARAFAQVRGADFVRVVLIGPLHRSIPGSELGAWMVPGEEAYRTPLGEVPVDRGFIAELRKRVSVTTVRGDREHSLEIELPFLQVVLRGSSSANGSGFELVPIMAGEYIGDPGTPAYIEQMAGALAEMCADGRSLLVASTDLTHLDNHAEVVRIDRKLVDLVSAFDVVGLSAALRAAQVQACGAVGLVTVLRAAQKLGAQGAQVLAYATSGDVTGDKRPGTYCVGYLAAAAYI